MEEPDLPGYHVASLTKGMEHMRPYVSVEARQTSAPPLSNSTTSILPQDSETQNIASKGEEESTYGVPSAVIEPARRPTTQQPQDAISNPQKRSDPFQFGSRYLEEGDDIFAFNAWDHVEMDDNYAAFADAQYQRQRDSPVTAFDASCYNATPEKWWNRFYTNNRTNFFKNRKWLLQEFPTLGKALRADSPPVTILEVGAGAGNTAFPLLAANENPGLRLHACDYSKAAVDLIRGHDELDERYMRADVWDVAATPASHATTDAINDSECQDNTLPPGVEEGSVDIVLLIFIFSALSPAQWDQALHNIWRVLKPGGEVLFRDYGRGDLAQVRFKKGRYLEDNFYVRGDGTRVYFFDQDELRELWTGNPTAATPDAGEEAAKEDDQANGHPFEVVNLAADRRLLVNRQRKLKMYRCWMQGRFRKPEL